MKRSMGVFLISLVLSCGAQNIQVTPSLNDIAVHIDVQVEMVNGGSIVLYRSTTDFRTMETFDCNAEPIVQWEVPARTSAQLIDSAIAAGTTYFYQIRYVDKSGKLTKSAVAKIVTPPKSLPYTSKPVRIVIDKRHYILTLYQGFIPLKRYAINLGGKPANRKLFYDNASTPEGYYSVAWLNQNSTFHRSLAVSYPNSEDRKRYARAVADGNVPVIGGTPAPIGGSIAIHGGGVRNNWTWGCIALNNSDIDKLMESGMIKAGTPILIGGFACNLDEMMRTP